MCVYIYIYTYTFGVSLTQLSLPCRFHICIYVCSRDFLTLCTSWGMLCIHVQQLCKGKERTPIIQRMIRICFEFQFSLPPNSKQIFSATPLILVCGFWSSTDWARWQCKTYLHDLDLPLTSTPYCTISLAMLALNAPRIPRGVQPCLYRCSEEWNSDYLGMFGGLGRPEMSRVSSVEIKQREKSVMSVVDE